MEKYSKEYFKKLANQIMFDISDEEVEELHKDFEDLDKQMALLEKIDTENVQEMVYPFEDDTYYVREDVVSNVVSKEEALQNAPKVNKGQIVVPKVVK